MLRRPLRQQRVHGALRAPVRRIAIAERVHHRIRCYAGPASPYPVHAQPQGVATRSQVHERPELLWLPDGAGRRSIDRQEQVVQLKRPRPVVGARGREQLIWRPGSRDLVRNAGLEPRGQRQRARTPAILTSQEAACNQRERPILRGGREGQPALGVRDSLSSVRVAGRLRLDGQPQLGSSTMVPVRTPAAYIRPGPAAKAALRRSA